MKTKYILVEWPESQKWMDHPDCYICDRITCAVFVPENIYNISRQQLELENTEYDFGHNVTYNSED